jgi:excisionase family DNA binding protein
LSRGERRRIPDRRTTVRSGRRATDLPIGAGWTTAQLARWCGLSSDFVTDEIHAGAIIASRFGREFRIHVSEVCRYCLEKNYPLPPTLQA